MREVPVNRRRLIAIVILAVLITGGAVLGIGFITRKVRTARAEAAAAEQSRARRTQAPRHLDGDAIARIRSKMDAAPGLAIEVGGVSGDSESLTLAAELRSAFNDGTFKLRELAEYHLPPTAPAGVSIYSNHELNQVLSEVVEQIFTEVRQTSKQWIGEDFTGAARANEPRPELKIIVGRAALTER